MEGELTVLEVGPKVEERTWFFFISVIPPPTVAVVPWRPVVDGGGVCEVGGRLRGVIEGVRE